VLDKPPLGLLTFRFLARAPPLFIRIFPARDYTGSRVPASSADSRAPRHPSREAFLSAVEIHSRPMLASVFSLRWTLHLSAESLDRNRVISLFREARPCHSCFLFAVSVAVPCSRVPTSMVLTSFRPIFQPRRGLNASPPLSYCYPLMCHHAFLTSRLRSEVRKGRCWVQRVAPEAPLVLPWFA